MIFNPLTITKEELDQLPYTKGNAGKKYTQIIIIPMDEFHSSGYRCMKFVIADQRNGYCETVAVVGGYSDVIHLWSGNANIDCLPCGYLRIILDDPVKLRSWIGSDFFVDKID